MREIKVGNKVTWYCRPHKRQPILCSGVVIKVFKSSTGGKRNFKRVVRINQLENYPFSRETTVVTIDKLLSVEDTTNGK